jgi:hypothetical protein
MKPMRLVILTATLALLSQPVLAFQQTTTESGGQDAAASDGSAQQSRAVEQGKGLDLATPGGVTIGKSNGTEVRIPGIGTVGVLPKLDFGLELLYGANNSDPKGLPEDKSEANDVQIRGTIKHRF